MTRPGDTVIRTEGLSKRFARQRGLLEILRRPFGPAQRLVALGNASLEVRRGEVFGLLGPNGAGKTTLLKILSCLVLPDAGRAEVNGFDTSSQEVQVKRSIGYVASDERSFYWRLTGAQNLWFFARLMRVPAAEIGRRVEHLLDRMELSAKANEAFSTYSSGMKQRLAIARALLHDPPILYLDEPTRSLDPVTARHIRDFVRQELVDREGKTVLLATHNLHEAAAICDRMAIMAASRVFRIGRLDDFRALLAAGQRYRLVTDQAVDLDGVATRITEDASGAEAPGRVAVHFEIPQTCDSDLSPIVARLAASGARVYDLSRVEIPLEDLFQQLFQDAAVVPAPPGGETC